MTDPVNTDALRDMGAALAADGHPFGARINVAANEVDRLRTVVENAPHDSLCNYGDSAVDFMGYPCTCWKADAR